MAGNKSEDAKVFYQQKDVHYKFIKPTFIGTSLIGVGKNEENNGLKPDLDAIPPEIGNLIHYQKQEQISDQDVQENVSEKKEKNCFHRTQKFLRNWVKKNRKLTCLFVVVMLLVILVIVIACYFSFNNGSEITKINKNETSSEKEKETSKLEKSSTSERKPSTPQTWSVLSSYIDTNRQNAKFTANYAGNDIRCNGGGNFYRWKWVYLCKCTDIRSGILAKCKNSPSQYRACTNSLAQLVRQMNKKNLYPIPSDVAFMPTGC